MAQWFACYLGVDLASGSGVYRLELDAEAILASVGDMGESSEVR